MVEADLPLVDGLLEAADVVVHNLDHVRGGERARLCHLLDHFLFEASLRLEPRFLTSQVATRLRGVLPDAVACRSGDIFMLRFLAF
jgi:hypothetical protein